MVPTTTTEGNGAADTAAATAAAARANTGLATTNALPASITTPYGNTPHESTHGSNTPHGKDPNGSIVTPGARPQYIRRGKADANTEANKEPNTPGFMSAQLLQYKQQLEIAQKTIASNRAIMKRYAIAEDHDSNFLEKAFEDIDPSNNNNNNNNNNTATANGTGTLC